MFLSLQTYEGLKISAFSHVESGIKSVMNQRTSGRRLLNNDNLMSLMTIDDTEYSNYTKLYYIRRNIYNCKDDSITFSLNLSLRLSFLAALLLYYI